MAILQWSPRQRELQSGHNQVAGQGQGNIQDSQAGEGGGSLGRAEESTQWQEDELWEDGAWNEVTDNRKNLLLSFFYVFLILILFFKRYSRREGFFKKLDKEKNKPNKYGKQLVFQFSEKVVNNFDWKWRFDI